MTSLNKVLLIGRVGQDPEVRYSQAGSAITNISVATSETWKDKNTGEKQERTEWHRVVLFGKTAEIAGEYLRKGSLVYIEGQLQTRKWTDKDGQDRYTTHVVVQPFSGSMKMLGSKSENNQGGSNSPNNQGWGQPQQPSAQPKNQNKKKHDEPPADFDDDIPF